MALSEQSERLAEGAAAREALARELDTIERIRQVPSSRTSYPNILSQREVCLTGTTCVVAPQAAHCKPFERRLILPCPDPTSPQITIGSAKRCGTIGHAGQAGGPGGGGGARQVPRPAGQLPPRRLLGPEGQHLTHVQCTQPWKPIMQMHDIFTSLLGSCDTRQRGTVARTAVDLTGSISARHTECP